LDGAVDGELPNFIVGVQSVRMPELPDIAAYISALETRILGKPMEHVRLASAFLLRTVQPPIANVEGHVVRELRRVGKRIAFGFDNDLWLVLP
jgi:formamidopyrimidine-DNA glycosylase